MWTIARIEEADYGCEERLPGEPLMLLITLESEDGRILSCTSGAGRMNGFCVEGGILLCG
jgi:hypothetical protein